jgi:hypothetical protein
MVLLQDTKDSVLAKRNKTWINIEEDEMSYGSSSRHNRLCACKE